MSLTDWLFSTCGSSHVGIYVCSKCGYQLVRSNLELKSFVKTSSLTIQSLLPPSTISAKSKGEEGGREDESLHRRRNANANGRRISFDSKSMLEDFSKNANLGRVFHKDSIRVSRLLGHVQDNVENQQMKYKISCGKCGRSLGHQTCNGDGGQSSYQINSDRVDLTFRPS